MPSLGNNKANLGHCVMALQLGCASATSFTTQQNQTNTLTVTATTGRVQISVKKVPKSLQAQKAYGYDTTYPTEFISVGFSVNEITTAGLLAAALAAAYPEFTWTDNGNATISFSTNGVYGMEVLFGSLLRVTNTAVLTAFDLSTYVGDVVLYATVSGANVRYRENGVAPTTTVGMLVVDGNPFDIAGKDNIVNTKFIQVAATAVVDYEICI